MEEAASLFVLKTLLLDDVVEQFATWHKLHNQKQLTARLDDLIQLHDVWVPHDLQNLDFAHDPCDVCLLLDLIFFQNFDCDLLLGQDMRSESHLAERALSNCLT